jgi:hypothetical protein
MSYCTNCGKPNSETAKFCTNCGAALTRSASDTTPDTISMPNSQQASDNRRPAKNNIIIFSILATAIALFGGYYFFLKHEPVRDGKGASSGYCDCGKKYIEAIVKVNEDFVNSFASYKFKKRQEARDKLQQLQDSANTSNLDCNNKAQIRYNSLRARYLNNIEQLTKFDASYSGNQALCVPGDQGRLATTYSLIESTIATIKDPEPDIERIKSDLIGKTIPGWSFQNLSEISQARISNTSSGSNVIEYTLDLKLNDLGNGSKHDARIIVTYVQQLNGWSYSKIREMFITYTNPAPLNTWQQVTVLQNCSYTILDNNQRYWVQDGSYGSKYKGGGKDADAYYLRSNQIFLMSREDYPVELVFKYTPN